MLKALYIFILIVELLAGIWTMLRFFLVNKRITKIHNNQQNYVNIKAKNKLLVVIPCLREQDIILDTIKYFHEISSDLDISIIIVTTQKEVYEKNISKKLIPQFIEDITNGKDINFLIHTYNKLIPSNNIRKILSLIEGKEQTEIAKIILQEINNCHTTAEIVKNFIASNCKYNNVHLLNYPKTDGIMADQLNYLLANLNKLNISKLDITKTYFSLYNADSRPDRNTFEEVICAINNHNFPPILQQYSACALNWDTLNNILKGFSLYQSNYELRSGLINSAFPSKYLLSRVVGHGLFARLDVLLEMDGFQTDFWCEDIYMGGYLANNKTPIIPLYSIENMETPESLKTLMKQNATWFHTSSKFTKIFKHIIKRQKKVTSNGFGWYLQMMRGAIAWLGIPFFVLYTMFYPIFIEHNMLLLIPSILSYLIFVVLTYFPTLKLMERLLCRKFPHKVKIMFFMLLVVLISNIGPLYCIFSKKNEKYKTAR